MECRRRFVLAVLLAAVSCPNLVRGRRVVIEVPVHIRSHQHTHTVYRTLPAARPSQPAAAPHPAAAPLPAAAPPPHAAPAAALVGPWSARPATVANLRHASQRVAHLAPPGGLTSITLVNLGRSQEAGPGKPKGDNGGFDDDDDDQPPQVRMARAQPPPLETNAEMNAETNSEASTETNAELNAEINAEINAETSTETNAEGDAVGDTGAELHRRSVKYHHVQQTAQLYR